MLGMGGMGELLKKLPIGANPNNPKINKQFDDQQLKHQIAIINSMTPKERRFPKTINGSRKRRIAKG